MKMDNSFATQKWNSNTWGCKFSQLQSHIDMPHYLHFFQACTCQLMLLNSISCIQRSCPSAHVRFCVFHSWQTNLGSSFKARKRDYSTFKMSKGKGYPVFVTFFVLQVSIFRFWYFKHTSWTSVVLFKSNLSSLKEKYVFKYFSYLHILCIHCLLLYL